MRAVSAARGLWRDHAPAPLRRRVAGFRTRRAETARRNARDLGELRRTTPFSTWGASRGGAIDRVYIGEFVGRHASDVRGRVLEIAGDQYARTYGSGVTRIDILDVVEDNPAATLIGDIADAPHLPADAFDCVLVTQVLPFVWDVRGPFRTAHRILRPEGVLLAASPGLCRIAPVEDELFGHWWNLTSRSARRLAEESFGEGNVEVEAFGNVLAAAAFLYGLGEWDVTPEELAVRDPAFEVTVGVRAVKRS